MVDEEAARRSAFVEGARIVLADGQTWSLSGRWSGRDDPEFDALLRAVFEADDVADQLRSELAMTIVLLSRNYQLGPADYQALLSFPPGASALSTLQRAVHEFVIDQARKFKDQIDWGRPAYVPPPIRWEPAAPSTWSARLRSLWS